MTDVIDGHPMINTCIVSLEKVLEPMPCEFPILVLTPWHGDTKRVALVASSDDAIEIGKKIHQSGFYKDCYVIVNVEMDLRKIAAKMSVN